MIETKENLPAFADYFAGIIGQSRIVGVLVRAVESFAMGGNIPSYAFLGQAGLGKTALMRCLESAMASAMEFRKIGGNPLLWVRSPEKFRLVSSEETQLVKEFCREVRPGFLSVDEFHELSSGYVGPTKKAFANFLKDALGEDAAKGALIKWGDDEERVHVSRKTFGVSVATNYPETVKDGPAIFRRFDSRLELDLLSSENVGLITSAMLSAKGIRADERTVKLIADCGRGTCELPSKISDELEKVKIISGKHTVNRDEVLQALRDLQRYPRGMHKLEMQILTFCASNAYKIDQLALMTGKEVKAVRLAVSYLTTQRTEGKATPFLEAPRGTYYRTTANGAQFAENCKKAQFVWENAH